MKKGYIILTDTGTCLTRLIKLYTKKPYNHASIALDEDLTDVYSFGRKHAINPFIGGFVREDLRGGLFKNATCTIYSFHMTIEQWNQLRQLVNKMEANQEKYRYHLLGLLGFLLNRPIERENASFCSEFVASSLTTCGIASFEKPAALIAPHELTDIPGLQLEFEGKLEDYVGADEMFPYPVPVEL